LSLKSSQLILDYDTHKATMQTKKTLMTAKENVCHLIKISKQSMHYVSVSSSHDIKW